MRQANGHMCMENAHDARELETPGKPAPKTRGRQKSHFVSMNTPLPSISPHNAKPGAAQEARKPWSKTHSATNARGRPKCQGSRLLSSRATTTKKNVFRVHTFPFFACQGSQAEDLPVLCTSAVPGPAAPRSLRLARMHKTLGNEFGEHSVVPASFPLD